MSHQELRMRCDLYKTGANSHRVQAEYAVVMNCIQLYLMNEETDHHFQKCVDTLHKLNSKLKTNFHFTDLIKSYIPTFEDDWGCMEKVCLKDGCTRKKCIKKKPLRAC